MERSKFIRNFLAGGGLLLAAPAFISSCSKEELENGDENNPSGSGSGIEIDLNGMAYSGLKTAGGFAYYENIIIIRTSDSQYTALSKICTHQSCTVAYSNSSKEVICPCHGSKFDSNGGVLAGPATAALKKYTVTVSGNTLKIS